jgi:DNA/RNA-binding protein KIN17
MDGEERERRVLADQIARARAISGPEEVCTGLVKTEGEKISLSLFPKPAPLAQEPGSSQSSIPLPSTSEDIKPTAFSLSQATSTDQSKAQPISIANPLKRPAPMNVFKTAKTPKTESGTDSGRGKVGYMSEAERLMKEDLARKGMGGRGLGSGGGNGGGGGGGGYSGMGPKRSGPVRSNF